MPALSQEKLYTIDDIYNLKDGERAELVNGHIYYMSPPDTKHQRILNFINTEINIYIRKNNGSCEVFPAPFSVFLFADDTKYLEPDISVICDQSKIDNKGCNGAPGWIIEIISPATKKMDYYTKLSLYNEAGVREYWIVDPYKNTTVVYDMEHDEIPAVYPFTDNIPVGICQGFSINLSLFFHKS
ncbi:MAG: Uma2 family endonuclease [Lachnospiraceae bacterium]|nr:Uma2 family endonuclease [Lachnospiraceae bacterium]